jgi:putative NADPH-quinone reductase
MLKGWIDRVFAPTVAFEQTPDFGPLKPLLTGLRKVVAITTLGSPWWMDRLVLWRPVRRQLKWAVF